MIAIEREKEREYASKEVKVISYLHTYSVEICIRIATVRCVLTIPNEREELYEGNSLRLTKIYVDPTHGER